MTRSQLFLSTLICFCIGIALHESLTYSPLWFGLISLTLLTLNFVLRIIFKITILFFLLTLPLTLGIWRGQATLHFPTSNTVDSYASEPIDRETAQDQKPEKVTIVGTIAEEPDIRFNKVNYTLKTSEIILPDETNQPISGYLLISTGKYPPRYFGDALEVSGHLQKPPTFDTFDYAGYLSRFNIYAVMYRPRIKMAEQRSTLSFSNWLFSLLLKTKASFEAQMNQTFSSEPSSSFMAGLLLGSRKGIPKDLAEDFRITGLTHIIAISGYNITLVVTIMMALFRPLGRRPAIAISAISVILFTLFVGASPAVVRACIMGLIALVALNSERKGNVTIALALTATLMIGYNPKILFHDVGFQLSFLATMGLIYVSPLIEKYFTWLPEQLAIRESVLLTISAQIMALPIILYNFNNLSIVSPLSNLLISGPIIPLAMLFGFIATLISYIYLPLAKLVAFPAYLLLEYITGITHLTAKIPYASVEVTWFSETLLILYFITLSTFLYRSWKKIHAREQKITHLQLQFQQDIARKKQV